MPSYKLTYFNGRGRAEVTRYMFAMNDVEYEDVRIPMGPEEWPKIKPTTPFGQLPILEMGDGTQYCQSTAIERLVAKRYSLYGSSDIENLKCDMVVQCAEDMLQAMMKVTTVSEAEKADYKKKLEEETLPTMLTNLEKMLGSSGLFVGSKISWPDISVAHILTFITVYGINTDLSKYEKLSKLKSKVEAQPKIAEWIKKRPETPF